MSNVDGHVAFSFRVHCSKGTYIRTLAVTIGELLGYPAHMSKLTRVASADFTANDCFTFDQLENILIEDQLNKIVYPLEKGISHLPIYELDDNLALRVKNGAVLTKPHSWPDEEVVMYHHGKAIAIYRAHPDKETAIKPVKVLRND